MTLLLICMIAIYCESMSNKNIKVAVATVMVPRDGTLAELQLGHHCNACDHL